MCCQHGNATVLLIELIKECGVNDAWRKSSLNDLPLSVSPYTGTRTNSAAFADQLEAVRLVAVAKEALRTSAECNLVPTTEAHAVVIMCKSLSPVAESERMPSVCSKFPRDTNSALPLRLIVGRMLLELILVHMDPFAGNHDMPLLQQCVFLGSLNHNNGSEMKAFLLPFPLLCEALPGSLGVLSRG